MTRKRVGGITFVRIGRLQLSYCVVKHSPSGADLTGYTTNERRLSRYLISEITACFLFGFTATWLYLQLAN